MTKLVNLVDAHFQKSNLFYHLPIFDTIHYLGHPDGKIQLYKATREGQECMLLAITIIRKEEDVLWEAAEDLLSRCVYDASTRMRGIFTFDLLTFDIHREVNTFNYEEFGALISNTARKIAPGEQRLIKYSTAYGLLQKLVVEPWAKVTLKTSIEVYNDKSEFLYTLVKRLFKLAQFPHNPLILLVNDLSGDPVFDPQNLEQQDFLNKTIEEKSKDSIEFMPEVYIQDRLGTRELLSKTIIAEPSS